MHHSDPARSTEDSYRVQLYLERIDAVIEWNVYDQKGIEDLRVAIADGELGPARILPAGGLIAA